jgi:hypothetical protein
MKKLNENIALQKFKQQLESDGEITLQVPACNLKILLEVKYNMKLELINKYTIKHVRKQKKKKRG